MPAEARIRAVVGTLREKGLLLPMAAGVAVLVTLAHGALTASRPEATPAMTPPATTTPRTPANQLPSLRPDLDNVPLRYHSDYWLQLGDGARTRLVAVGEAVLTGVVVAPGLALTALAAANEAGAPGSLERLLGFDESLGAALVELPTQLAPAAFRIAPTESLLPGALMAAVSLGGDHRLRVSPGFLVSAPTSTVLDTPLDLQVEFAPGFGAAAVVDLDGRLAGFAVERGGEVHVFPASVLERLTSHLRNRQLCFAIEVADLVPAVAELTGLSGVLVEQVRRSAFVPEPSVLAGDVLVEWNGQPVERADTFRALYEAGNPGDSVSFQVVRAGRPRAGRTILPDRLCRPTGAAPVALEGLGLTLSWFRTGAADGRGGSGWQVVDVTPDSPAGLAGVQPGDWLLRLDDRSLDARESVRLLETFEKRRRAGVLALQRGDRVRLAAVAFTAEQP